MFNRYFGQRLDLYLTHQEISQLLASPLEGILDDFGRMAGNFVVEYSEKEWINPASFHANETPARLNIYPRGMDSLRNHGKLLSRDNGVELMIYGPLSEEYRSVSRFVPELQNTSE